MVTTFITYPDAFVTLTYQIEDELFQIIGTTDHPFWLKTEGRFEEMGHLRLGDQLLTNGKAQAQVVGLSLAFASQGATFQTYNFEVADYHTYFAAESGSD